MTRTSALWTFAITSIALFMVTLDNLVVTMALAGDPRRPRRVDRGPRVDRQRVHAHLRRPPPDRSRPRRPLRTPADVRDRDRHLHRSPLRPPRSRPSIEALIAARAVQGVGGAIVTPLTLTHPLAPRVRPSAAGSRWARGAESAASRSRSVRSSAAPSSKGISWQWIFWLNVPIGLALHPARASAAAGVARPATRARPAGPRPGQRRPLRHRLGPRPRRTLRAGRASRCWAPSRRAACSWPPSWLWELRAPAPMLPMRFFRNRTFAATNVASLFMFFGMFGSIFLLAQFLQIVQGYSPLDAGLRIAALDGDADLHRPDRRRPLRPDRRPAAHGDRARASRRSALAWLAAISTPTFPYLDLVPAVRDRRASAWRSSSRRSRTSSSRRFAREEEGQASGANNAIRELGGVFGVAVLASIFASYGGYESRPGVRGRPRPGRLGRRSRRRRRCARGALHPAQATGGRSRGGPRRAGA